MAIYEIPEYRLEEFEKKISHISKKFQKYGGSSVSYKKGELYYKKVKHDGNIFTIRVFPVEVEGSARVDNWEFIGTLEHHNNGNIIKRYNMNIEIPERFKFSKNICEHCHTNRYRTNLYIIYNTETGEFKQIGKSCLKLYTGGLSAEHVAAMMEFMDWLEEDDGGYCIDSFYDRNYMEIEEVLCVAQAVIAKYGYTKTDREPSTKSIVSTIVQFDIGRAEREFRMEMPEESSIYTESALQMVKDMISYYLSLDDDSEFTHNIKVLLSEGYCNKKNIGLLAYLPFGYQKAKEKTERECKQIESNSVYDYFGEIGKRYKELKVTLSILTSYDTEYGITYIYKMEDSKYHVFTWKTGKGFEPGTYTATMSIKDHKEYRGQKQTEVTRCKLSVA